jgi:3D (Asp-Asp-Asp) domain-containing protein
MKQQINQLLVFIGLIAIFLSFMIVLNNREISFVGELQDAKIERLQMVVKALNQRIDVNNHQIVQFQQRIDEMSIVDVKATAYNAVPRQTDNDPNVTSCMSVPTVGSIAVSQDLYYKGWTCGKRVHLDQLGIFIVKDVFPKYYKGKLVTNQIDVLTETEEQAFEFGVKHNVKAVLLSHYEKM